MCAGLQLLQQYKGERIHVMLHPGSVCLLGRRVFMLEAVQQSAAVCAGVSIACLDTARKTEESKMPKKVQHLVPVCRRMASLCTAVTSSCQSSYEAGLAPRLLPAAQLHC